MQPTPTPTRRLTKQQALGLLHALRQEGARPNFLPNPAVLGLIETALDDEECAELERMQTARKAAGVANHIIRHLRMVNAQVEWWAVHILSAVVWAELYRRPVPSLRSMAHRMRLTKRDLEDLGNHATLDSAAVLWLYLTQRQMKDIGLPMTPAVKARAVALKHDLEKARKFGRWTGHPMFDPVLRKIEAEQKR